MDDINYNDFENICRTCLLKCDHKFLLEPVILDIYYKLTETHFDIKDELPQQICLKCYESIIETNEFSLQCKQAHSRLIKCLNEFKNVRIKAEDPNIQETYEFVEIKEEITIEEHEIKFVDELQIKAENTEETSDEIIIDRNSVQDFNENVENKGMSNDNTNQNDLNEDSCSDSTESTNIKEISNEISEGPYKCDLCPKTFKHKGILNVHKIKHGIERPLMCNICNKTFSRSSNLNAHKLIHSGKRPYECEICNKTFVQSSNLVSHTRIHSGERPYECEICNKSFTTSSNLVTHKRIHSGSRPYECEICNKTFMELAYLNRHKRKHSGERPYECEICNKTFMESGNLIRHKRTIHSNERNIGRKSLESSSGSKTKETVNTVELFYKCDVCPKSYKRLSLLQGHKKTHNPNLNDSIDTSN